MYEGVEDFEECTGAVESRNIGKKGVPYGTGNPIPDIDDTCMALRLARSHGYEISPGETILEDAKPLLQRYLQYCIKSQVDDKWMHNVNNPKYLELAKLEYNRLQAIHKREINYVLKWWNNCGLDDPFVTRICPQEIYFSITATLYEPELEDCRITYTKSNFIEDIVRDMFQNHGSIQDLKLFCQAIEQWNPSLIHSLSQRIQVIFMAMYNILNELAIEASNAQGKDVFSNFHDLRSKQVQDYMKSRLIIETKQISSWTEYFENGKKDCGVAIRTVPNVLFMGENMVDNILRCLDSHSKENDRRGLPLVSVPVSKA
ncbi:uncharacterized protein A4U43_C07F22400 [Asparagus officinalis]|uniref:Terpene synthase metal-binding domain-containing protein n=1 Tax=Asparagus officinalis TaxID=4686 RepID=A0A5P1EHF9_ASPOF|nr:uncharacterized protein A4U43_C07F22400 [Asparagus officinalis]